MNPPQRMKQEPEPVPAGTTAKITYDTTDCTFPIILTVRGRPCDSEEVYLIMGPEDHVLYVPVPEGCEGGVVEDDTFQSQDFAIIIS